MRNALAIMQRELLSLFCSPIAYIVIFGFLLLTGVVVLVTESLLPGKPASLRQFFQFTPFVLTIIIPAITMRAISEEYRSGSIELLMTAPVSDTQMVVGKYLATTIFYAILLGGTLVYLVIMWMFGRPDVGASLASYLGLLLIGALFCAFGVFTSSLSRNQIVAWMAATIPLLLFVWFASYIVTVTTGVWRDVFQTVNVMRHLDQFNRGLVTLESAAFFLVSSVLFVFLSIKVVESRRWR